jgi:uncharacterized OsmC-like protein
MKCVAKLQNSLNQHHVTLSTNENIHTLVIAPKETGFGSGIIGGELLFLALATCFCNDIYREASKTGIKVEQVEVEVEGEFGAEGEPAKNLSYKTKITAQAGEVQIREMINRADQMAEIQNTLRLGIPVVLRSVEIISI